VMLLFPLLNLTDVHKVNKMSIFVCFLNYGLYSTFLPTHYSGAAYV
jgi:hypothetical protein